MISLRSACQSFSDAFSPPLNGESWAYYPEVEGLLLYHEVEDDYYWSLGGFYPTECCGAVAYDPLELDLFKAVLW